MSIAISGKTNSIVSAHAAPGLRYNAFSMVIANTEIEILPTTQKKIFLKQFFVPKKLNKRLIQSKLVIKSEVKKNVSPSIFGTTYDSKLFLTATSSLSIDKQDVSPLLTSRHIHDVTASSLVRGIK